MYDFLPFLEIIKKTNTNMVPNTVLNPLNLLIIQSMQQLYEASAINIVSILQRN